MEAQEERKEIKKKEDRKMCKHMRGKAGAPMLGSEEMEVAGGHQCTGRQPVCFLFLLKVFHKP